MTNWLHGELDELKEKNLYRKLRVVEELRGTEAVVDGRRVTLFCANDYLGLSRHPEVVQTAKQALDQWGVGAGSARLIAGTSRPCAELEERIARFEGKERALVFSSGYLANVGTISALAGPEDIVILDKLCHASLVDAAKLSEATIRVYPHKNLDYLEKLLKKLRARRIWIVTDSIFSMDGDFAPLRELAGLKNRYGAYLVIDEAHGTGVFGKNGRGLAEYLKVTDEIDVHIGTLSKAVGTLGGFVTAKRHLIDYLVNRARTFIFATALPPAVCAAAGKAFDLIETHPELRARLFQNVKRLRQGLRQAGLPVLEGESPIIPVLFGDEKKTLEAAQSLFEKGFLVPAVRTPTVPKGKARLRITVSALHTDAVIDKFIAACG